MKWLFTSRITRHLRAAGLFLGLLLLASLLASCATIDGRDEDADSDLPWATPAEWEGTPAIPGFGGGH